MSRLDVVRMQIEQKKEKNEMNIQEICSKSAKNEQLVSIQITWINPIFKFAIYLSDKFPLNFPLDCIAASHLRFMNQFTADKWILVQSH